MNLLTRIRSKKVKDVLFRSLFENDKDALLELYNALNNSEYTNPNDIEVVTIKSTLYVTHKNDLAYIVAGVINLYEHQSTINPNMPVRFLIYLGQEYQLLIAQASKSVYGDSLIKLPTPKCVVFYNGDKNLKDTTYLHLSDAYINKKVQPDLNLSVKVININSGYNNELKDKCRTLYEYSEFVRILKENRHMYKDIKLAISETIDYCINHNILAAFLRRNRAEVPGMLLSTFEKDKYDYTLREEGREEGRDFERMFLIKNALKSNSSPSQISEMLGIPVEEIIAIQNSSK